MFWELCVLQWVQLNVKFIEIPSEQLSPLNPSWQVQALGPLQLPCPEQWFSNSHETDMERERVNHTVSLTTRHLLDIWFSNPNKNWSKLSHDVNIRQFNRVITTMNFPPPYASTSSLQQFVLKNVLRQCKGKRSVQMSVRGSRMPFRQ